MPWLHIDRVISMHAAPMVATLHTRIKPWNYARARAADICCTCRASLAMPKQASVAKRLAMDASMVALAAPASSALAACLQAVGSSALLPKGHPAPSISIHHPCLAEASEVLVVKLC